MESRAKGQPVRTPYESVKVHVLLDSATALPIMLTITAAGYGENRAAGWFVAMVLRLG